MDIKPGITLSTKGLISFLGVSDNVWKRKKEQLLQHFGNYYEYEVIYRGRNIDYHIIDKIKDYEPIPKKSTKRDKIYKESILEVIAEDNIQTAMNVSRIIKNNDSIKQYNHKDSTVYEYTRVNMRNMFGVKVNQGGTNGIIERKVWCKLIEEYNFYEEMCDEDIAELYNLFSTAKESAKEIELEIFCDYQNGLITKDEMFKQIGESGFRCFAEARKNFYNKYGYYPIKVPVYEISAFERSIEECQEQ